MGWLSVFQVYIFNNSHSWKLDSLWKLHATYSRLLNINRNLIIKSIVRQNAGRGYWSRGQCPAVSALSRPPGEPVHYPGPGPGLGLSGRKSVQWTVFSGQHWLLTSWHVWSEPGGCSWWLLYTVQGYICNLYCDDSVHRSSLCQVVASNNCSGTNWI